mmetsp:Transcript_12139/g.48746  ORF Transcript_12139/g.48746 Transcript_12139/m.48746 type:complete len:220 (-) Transcript_12139:2352-3011(-)
MVSRPLFFFTAAAFSPAPSSDDIPSSSSNPPSRALRFSATRPATASASPPSSSSSSSYATTPAAMDTAGTGRGRAGVSHAATADETGRRWPTKTFPEPSSTTHAARTLSTPPPSTPPFGSSPACPRMSAPTSQTTAPPAAGVTPGVSPDDDVLGGGKARIRADARSPEPRLTKTSNHPAPATAGTRHVVNDDWRAVAEAPCGVPSGVSDTRRFPARVHR